MSLVQYSYKEFGPAAFETRKQMTAIAKLEDFRNYIAHPYDQKIYVRRDSVSNDFMIANAQQKYVLRIWATKHGKIFGYIIYRRRMEDGKIFLDIHKKVGEV